MESRSEKIRRAKAVVAEHGPAMAERYEAGETLSAVAERYGVMPMTVAREVRRRGVVMREAGNAGKGDAMRSAREIRREHGAAMAAEYAAGATLEEVGQRYSVALGVVRQAVRDHGGVMRKRGFGSTPERFTMSGNPRMEERAGDQGRRLRGCSLAAR
jgi:hypothetical protein